MAHASVTLPAANLQEIFDYYPSGTFTYIHGSSSALNGAAAAIGESPAGLSLTASSSMSSFGGSSLSFSTAITGPAGVTSIPLELIASYQLATPTDPTANPNGNPSGATSYLSYSGFTTHYLVLANTNDTNALNNGSQNTASATIDYITSVPLNTKLNLGLTTGANGAGGTAAIQETIGIASSFFTDNPQYSPSDFTFAYSSGIDFGTAVSVREPASLLLITPLLALALLAAYHRPARQA